MSDKVWRLESKVKVHHFLVTYTFEPTTERRCIQGGSLKLSLICSNMFVLPELETKLSERNKI